MPLRPHQSSPAQILGILPVQISHDTVLQPHTRLSTASPASQLRSCPSTERNAEMSARSGSSEYAQPDSYQLGDQTP
jgi:hypothetical protein